MQIETIKIKDDNRRGFKTINKSDFKKGVHKEYEDKKTKKELLVEEALSLNIDNPEELTITQLKDHIKMMKA